MHQLQLIQPSMLWLFPTSNQNDGCIRPLHFTLKLLTLLILFISRLLITSHPVLHMFVLLTLTICPNMYMCMFPVFFVIPAVVWWRKMCVPLTWRVFEEQKAQPASVELDLQSFILEWNKIPLCTFLLLAVKVKDSQKSKDFYSLSLRCCIWWYRGELLEDFYLLKARNKKRKKCHWQWQFHPRLYLSNFFFFIYKLTNVRYLRLK